MIPHRHRLFFLCAFDGHGEKGIGALLDLWTRPEWGATHWGPDERAGKAFDRAALIEWMAREEGRPGVARRNALSWNAGWYGLDGGLFQVNVDWDELPATAAELPFRMADAMADLLAPIWGQVQPAFRGLGAFWNQVTNVSGEELVKCGPMGVTARTWMGPHVINLIGEQLLRGVPAGVHDAAGGVCLELLPEPWKQDAALLVAKQREVVDYLAPAGIWGDYAKVLNYEPGPRWTAPVP